MCVSGGGSPEPLPPPPVQAPPAAPAAMQTAKGINRNDNSAVTSGRGRNALRIDRTKMSTGSTGSGLNIPL